MYIYYILFPFNRGLWPIEWNPNNPYKLCFEFTEESTYRSDHKLCRLIYNSSKYKNVFKKPEIVSATGITGTQSKTETRNVKGTIQSSGI